MQTAEAILDIYQKRGVDGLPLERVYRHMFDPEYFLQAYGKIYRNFGAMTRGTTEETVDGMRIQKIHNIIALLKLERYEWTPVRRTEIPKANGKMRPLGIPTWSDKLVQEVLRSLLEPYYERRFSDHSHGFRPDRGCHTALREIKEKWKGTVWFIEGDIKGCFYNIDHEILLSRAQAQTVLKPPGVQAVDSLELAASEVGPRRQALTQPACPGWSTGHPSAGRERSSAASAPAVPSSVRSGPRHAPRPWPRRSLLPTVSPAL